MNSTKTVSSPACDLVMSREHPPYSAGGPCHDCAFREGTEANASQHTVMMARLCVEGFRQFDCHVHPGICRGFVAALNVRGVPETEEERRWQEVTGAAADLLAECVAAAKAEDEAVALPPTGRQG